MVRFFVNPEEFYENFIVLTGENANHAKVLRLRTGDEVMVCDGQGKECICTISDMSQSQVCLAVQSSQISESEPAVKVSVYMAFSKGDKFEHVIQKATEIGAHEIVAFPSARCVSKPDEKSLAKKLERWQKIAASAAEQSGRGIVPTVYVVSGYIQALERALAAEKTIFLYENERATTLRMALGDCSHRSVSLISGPEGGFEAHEVKRAIDKGIEICTLGRRILRCETAPLCALSAVMYAYGEF